GVGNLILNRLRAHAIQYGLFIFGHDYLVLTIKKLGVPERQRKDEVSRWDPGCEFVKAGIKRAPRHVKLLILPGGRILQIFSSTPLLMED
ncbi:hypothetical protein A2U01_0080652, partial [Trifolium medium]|nr:hypothetical protein [Trifolium medium]